MTHTPIARTTRITCITRTTRSALAAALAAIGFVGGACGGDDPASPADEEATIVFAFEGLPDDTLRVRVRHAPTIAAARAYIDTKQGPRIPVGRIVRGAGSDPTYPFHFVPTSVRLAEATIELCDGAPMRTPAEVDAFITGATGKSNARSATWCPWSAYPIEIRD
jgi:hypothetical protein